MVDRLSGVTIRLKADFEFDAFPLFSCFTSHILSSCDYYFWLTRSQLCENLMFRLFCIHDSTFVSYYSIFRMMLFPHRQANPPTKTQSNLPRNLAHSLGPLGLPLIPQSSVDKVRLQDQQSQVPHQGDGIEEVGVAAAGVQPQVVESWAQQGGVQKSGEGWEGVAVG
jgi:hypothetical protein